jgi:hypothetical protein
MDSYGGRYGFRRGSRHSEPSFLGAAGRDHIANVPTKSVPAPPRYHDLAQWNLDKALNRRQSLAESVPYGETGDESPRAGVGGPHAAGPVDVPANCLAIPMNRACSYISDSSNRSERQEKFEPYSPLAPYRRQPVDSGRRVKTGLNLPRKAKQVM